MKAFFIHPWLFLIAWKAAVERNSGKVISFCLIWRNQIDHNEWHWVQLPWKYLKQGWVNCLWAEKNYGVTEQQIDNAIKDKNSGKGPFEEAQKLESSFKTHTTMWNTCRQRITRMGTSWWACFLRQYLQKFFQHKNLKDSILSENPVPMNSTKTRKLDEYYKERLQENGTKRELALDGTLEKIQ